MVRTIDSAPKRRPPGRGRGGRGRARGSASSSASVFGNPPPSHTPFPPEPETGLVEQPIADADAEELHEGASPPDTSRRVERERTSTAPRRYRTGYRPVDKEIRKLQADHNYLSFSRVGFARLVREIQNRYSEEPFRWSAEALLLFQKVAEEYLMYLYADAYLATHHRRCVTLNAEDLRLVRRLRQPHCWGETL